MVEVNKIEEIYNGHYQVMLDFPTPTDLVKVIDNSYQFICRIDHNEGRSSWLPYVHTLFGERPIETPLFARNISMEFLCRTTTFIKLLLKVKQTVRIIQTNIMPPEYLELKKLSGKPKYDLLKSKLSYLFEIEIPGATDYAPLISSNISFLHSVIEKFK